jgi:hypothetical protein
MTAFAVEELHTTMKECRIKVSDGQENKLRDDLIPKRDMMDYPNNPFGGSHLVQLKAGMA